VNDDVLPLATRFDLRGRHIAVTGAANGLGLAICQGLLEFGALVTAIDHDGDALKAAADKLGADAAFAPQVCDVADQDAIATVIAESAGAHGGLDAAFANAGIAGGPSLEVDEGRIYELDWATFDHVMAVNLRGALATIKSAAVAMRPRGRGSIVATVSTAGLRGESMVGYGYNCSKGALTNLVRQAAIDLARDGIRVNGIAPGPIDGTNIGGPGPAPDHIVRKWNTTTVQGRMGEPHEIQGLANFLASDASSFITGTVIALDGGGTSGFFATLPDRAR
jgi:NAD(P)-dependent dehydrogenase (short-subunit alcohol dehydrogenase family)